MTIGVTIGVTIDGGPCQGERTRRRAKRYVEPPPRSFRFVSSSLRGADVFLVSLCRRRLLSRRDGDAALPPPLPPPMRCRGRNARTARADRAAHPDCAVLLQHELQLVVRVRLGRDRPLAHDRRRPRLGRPREVPCARATTSRTPDAIAAAMVVVVMVVTTSRNNVPERGGGGGGCERQRDGGRARTGRGTGGWGGVRHDRPFYEHRHGASTARNRSRTHAAALVARSAITRSPSAVSAAMRAAAAADAAAPRCSVGILEYRPIRGASPRP